MGDMEDMGCDTGGLSWWPWTLESASTSPAQVPRPFSVLPAFTAFTA